jgi:hypothetical protein
MSGKIGIKKDFYLPSAASFWFLLTWQALLFKSLDKIVFVPKLCYRAEPWLALNFWGLSSDLAGLCQ